MAAQAEVGGFGLGLVKLGSAAAGGPRAGVRLVHESLDRGVRFFDTADAYGDGTSERVLGQALRGRRDGVTVATKGGYRFAERSAAERAARRLAAPVLGSVRALRERGRSSGAPGAGGTGSAYAERDFSPAHLRAAVDGSLRRLRTDHIDLYQLHGPVAVCGDDVAMLMGALRREGKIGRFGVGLEVLDHAQAWLEVDGVTSMQLPFGVLDPEAGREVIPAAQRAGVDVIARAVFAAGLLVDTSPGATALLRPEQRALRTAVLQLAEEHGVHPLGLAAWFARATPGVRTVLVGVSSSRHLADNLAHLTGPEPSAGALAALGDALADYAALQPAGAVDVDGRPG